MILCLYFTRVLILSLCNHKGLDSMCGTLEVRWFSVGIFSATNVQLRTCIRTYGLSLVF